MGWRDWTGVGERRWKTAPDEQVQPSKTLWDLLQLLIVPVILVAVSLWWSASQTASDNKREDRRIAADRVAAEQVRQDAALSDYIERMSGLMLHEKLLTAKPPKLLSGQPPLAVRSLARTVTLTSLRRLDGERRGKVVLFLQEASLINQNSGPRVRLADADLRGADLRRADLRGADLTYADLSGAALRGAALPGADLFHAALRGAFLADADLTGAKLTGAYLTDADLRDADLRGADLRGAFVRGADLTNADLSGADLRGAALRGADLTNADLSGADLRYADLTDADLTDAKLKGAKGLPKGSR
jgi:pentapeptide repeat protein